MEIDHKKRIEELIKAARVFVFMKGTGEEPACRFSMQAVEALRAAGVDKFGWCNVLEDEAMRQAVKDFTGWPTIPQIFVEGKFIGGADIISEMAENGELKVLLG